MAHIYSKDKYNFLNTGPRCLHPDLIRDAVELLSFFVLTALRLCQMLPELGVCLASPIFHLILPILIGDGIIEQSNSVT